MRHSSSQQFARVAFVILIALTPLCGLDVGVVITAWAAVWIAYEPLHLRSACGIVGLAVGMELFYGLDMGTWSLGVACAVGCIEILQRRIGITPWSSRSGWHGVDMVRWAFVAAVVAVVVRGGTWASLWLLYRVSDLSIRAAGMMRSVDLLFIGILAMVLVFAWRRIDEPFRRPIQFGI